MRAAGCLAGAGLLLALSTVPAGAQQQQPRNSRRRRLQLPPPPRMAEAFVAQNPDCVQPNHPAQTRLKSGSSRPTSPFRAQKMQRQSGGVMKLDRSLCNANVSLTDLIKGWFVALTKQLNA